jgi:hypothetical protein
MDTRRKTVFRVGELAELRRRFQEPLTPAEQERRHRAIEQMRRFQESMPPIPGDIKDWIRADRGEKAGA